MFGKSTVSVVILSAGLFASPALANTVTPAEMPPANYAASQYVDSKGCVFVRAGAAGNVTWIPRMDRARSHICNARPSAVARAPQATTQGVRTAASAAAPAPAAPARTILRSSQTRLPTTIAVTTPTTTNLLIGSTRSTRTTTTTVATNRVPLTTTRTTPRASTQHQQASSCTGASALSRQYINHGQHGPVRCGPQPVHPMDVHRPNGARPTATTGGVIAATLGRPPFEAVNAQPRTPAGYRVAWDDGRLNPNRGNRAATQVATAPHVNRTATTVSTRNAPAATRAAAAPAPQGRVSVSVGVGHRFVQVGTYREMNNAQRAIRALQQLGLPAARSVITSRGQEYQVVLAGPYSSAQSLGNALHKARQAGFHDAITRR